MYYLLVTILFHFILFHLTIFSLLMDPFFHVNLLSCYFIICIFSHHLMQPDELVINVFIHLL